MRVEPARRMLWLTGFLLVVGGCQSTGVTRDAEGGSSKHLAQRNAPKSSDITWKKSPVGPSAALAQVPGGQPDVPLKATGFQPAGNEQAPFPDLMPKVHDIPPTPQIAPVQPVGLRHHGRHNAPPMPLPNAPNELNLIAMPSHIIRPPDVLMIELNNKLRKDDKGKIVEEEIGFLHQPIKGPHLVRPDGTIELGVYGPLRLAGMTVPQARVAIVGVIRSKLNPEKISEADILNYLKVEVANYNSSVYYVITNYAGAAGIGEVVERFPITGSDTVLDALSKVKHYGNPNLSGLPGMTSPGRIWVARANPGDIGPETILPVDWKGITQQGRMTTNWQVMPGDRIYLQADPIRRFDSNLAKVLSPIQRLLSVAQGINSLRSGNNTNLIAPPPP